MIERNLFGILVTTITSKQVLVKFDSFQRPLPTFSFVAVLPNCLFFSNVSGAFQRFSEGLVEKYFYPEKNFALLFGHENYFQAVFMCFNSFLTFLTDF